MEAHEDCTPTQRKHDSGQERSNKALHGFFGRQFDKRGTSDGATKNVGEDVVTDNEWSRHPEPDETFKNIIHDKVTDYTSVFDLTWI